MDYLSDLAMERDEVVPSALSSTDASALISRYVDRDSIPNPELFQYADEMHISVSYYTGKRMLYDTVFAQLDSFTRTAFFIFCVYRDVDHCMTGNLNDCPILVLIYAFSVPDILKNSDTPCPVEVSVLTHINTPETFL